MWLFVAAAPSAVSERISASLGAVWAIGGLGGLLNEARSGMEAETLTRKAQCAGWFCLPICGYHFRYPITDLC